MVLCLYINRIEEFMEKKIEKLFSNLCCSQCRNGFDADSIKVKRDEDGLLVISLECKHCGKNFGVAFLGFSDIAVKESEPLVVKEGPEPINYDDVIDAHRFIQDLKGDWNKYIK